MSTIYFDHAATTAVAPEVKKEMDPYFCENYGNASSLYELGYKSKEAINIARGNVARTIKANPKEIYFTSCGSESDNLAIKGVARANRRKGNHIITSKIEHPAVLNTCRQLEREGFIVTYLNVDRYGKIDINELKRSINNRTILVSIMFANNEVGTISDVSKIAKLCAKNGIAIHSDLTQAIGKITIDIHDMGIDFASCSAHKIYGPKGIGAAFVKSDAYGIPPITAFMHGGEQENGFRAGTLAVHNIVGFGKAAEIALRDFAVNEERIRRLDQMLIAGITEISDISLTNKSDKRLPGIVSIVVDKKDFNNERFIKHISDRLALSTGSACSAGELSYVITALGLEDKVSKVLRISLNKHTTEEEINQLIKILREEL